MAPTSSDVKEPKAAEEIVNDSSDVEGEKWLVR